jgi:hypothetical protein
MLKIASFLIRYLKDKFIGILINIKAASYSIIKLN